MSMTSVLCCRVNPTMTTAMTTAMTHTVTYTVTTNIPGAMTPDGDWNGTRWRSSNASSTAWNLRWKWIGRRRNSHVRGLGRDGWLWSHFWGDYV